jgi:hypothetical protein
MCTFVLDNINISGDWFLALIYLKRVAKLGIRFLKPKVKMVWKHFLEELFWSAAEASLIIVKHVVRRFFCHRFLYVFKK